MRLSKILLLSTLVSFNVCAQDIKIVGTIEHTATAPQGKSLTFVPTTKKITLLKIELSDAGKKVLQKRAATVITKNTKTLAATNNVTAPSKVSLGMNNVPVLDQGSHGSCVTFANTAAIDALLNKGDYISQLCLLQLGSYLEKNGYASSGWNGTLGRLVLNQIEQFGVVGKDKEQSVGCGDLHAYPTTELHNPDSMMTPEQFHQLSENVSINAEAEIPMTWSPLLDVYQAVLERTDTNKVLNEVKKALNANDRVTFGVLLYDADLGFMGAAGTYKSKYDTWTMTPELYRDLYLQQSFGGHEMVITGYDDNAVTTDDKGRQYKGLLTLRNSWSDKYGDQGDFYMTYDYFKILVIEANRIRNLSDMVEQNQANIG